jgi:hypothetical protein
MRFLEWDIVIKIIKVAGRLARWLTEGVAIATGIIRSRLTGRCLVVIIGSAALVHVTAIV